MSWKKKVHESKVSIVESCEIWKLRKLKVAKVESCETWKF